MPRSGSSILTNLIRSAGYDVDCRGTKPLMKPNKDFNPDGYFERIDVVKMNDEIIDEKSKNSNFLNPPTVFNPLTNWETIKKICQFNDLQNSYDGWVLKDARFAFTFSNFSLKNLNIILLSRNAEDVKKSMIRHYGNIFDMRSDEYVTQGPHKVYGITFEDLQNRYSDAILKQTEYARYKNILKISYEQILEQKLDVLEEFIEGKVNKALIK